MALCNYKTLRRCLSRLLFIFAVSYILCLLSLLRSEQYAYPLPHTIRFAEDIRHFSHHGNNSGEKTWKITVNKTSVDNTEEIKASKYNAFFLRSLKESNSDAIELNIYKKGNIDSSKKSFHTLGLSEKSVAGHSYSFSPMPSFTKSNKVTSELPSAATMSKKNNSGSPQSLLPIQDILNDDKVQIKVSQSIVHFTSLGEDFYVYGVYLDDRYFPDTYVRIMVLRSAKYNGGRIPNNKETPTEYSDPVKKDFNIWCHFQKSLFLTNDDTVSERSVHIKTKTFSTIKVRAKPYEMCENHSKKFGGWIYSCSVPSNLVNFTANTSGHFPHTITLSRLNSGRTNDRTSLENIQVVPLRQDLKNILSKTVEDNLSSKSNQNRSRRGSVQTVFLEKTETSTIPGSRGVGLDSKKTDSTSKPSNNEQNLNKFTKSPNSGSQIPRIGVCVPPMYGAVLLQKLVNFIELCNIMGAHKVFLYSHDSPEILLSYLSHYTGQRPDILSLVRWNIPLIPQTLQHEKSVSSTRSATSSTNSDTTAFRSEAQSRFSSLDEVELDETPHYFSDQTVWNHGQLLAVQHCLYSNMADFDWLLFMDLDEMLVPRNVSSWSELIRQILSSGTYGKTADLEHLTGLSFESAFFQQDFRSHVTNSIEYFQYLHRTQQTSSKRSKMLVRPRGVFELGIHHLSKPVVVEDDFKGSAGLKQDKKNDQDGKKSSVLKVPPTIALMHHYRKCVQDPDEPDEKTLSENIRGSAWTENGWVPIEKLRSLNFECNILVKDETILKYEADLTIVSRNVTNSAMSFFARES